MFKRSHYHLYMNTLSRSEEGRDGNKHGLIIKAYRDNTHCVSNDTVQCPSCTIVLPHMCILAHMRMGRPICVYSYGMPIRVWDNILSHIAKYFIGMFCFFTGCWILLL